MPCIQIVKMKNKRYKQSDREKRRKISQELGRRCTPISSEVLAAKAKQKHGWLHSSPYLIIKRKPIFQKKKFSGTNFCEEYFPGLLNIVETPLKKPSLSSLASPLLFSLPTYQ